MSKGAASSGDNHTGLGDAWTAALCGDREAFQAAVRPHLRGLVRAARREVRYRVALGDFDRDDPTPEELIGEVLIRAWQKRNDRPSPVRLKVWLLALLYRVAHELSRRQGREKRLPKESLEEPVPPEPIYDETKSSGMVPAG